MQMPDWDRCKDASTRKERLRCWIPLIASAGNQALSSQSFRFALLGFVVLGAVFSLRSPSLATPERSYSLAAAAQDSGISPIQPRLYRPVVDIPVPMPNPADTLSNAAYLPSKPVPGQDGPKAVCKALEGNALTTQWGPSPLFAGEMECHSEIKTKGFALLTIARGSVANQIDVLRLKLTVNAKSDLSSAGAALSKRFVDAASLLGLVGIADTAKTLAALEETDATIDGYSISLAPERNASDRYDLVIRRGEPARSTPVPQASKAL